MGVQSIQPGAVVSRIWEIYRDQFGVLFGAAVVLFALQFVVYLVLPGGVGFLLVLLFWAVSVLYQGTVVQLVRDVQDGRRDHSVGELLRSVEPVFWPLVGVSILFGIVVAIGYVLLIASGEAVAAIDATFSAPKSVSAVWAVADTELRIRIEAAHEQAIDRALRYATSQVPMVPHRADRGGVVHAKAAELIATSWRHTTARAVGERVPDPQLHSHVLLHAAVRDDQRVVAIDSRAWFVHRRELGAAYRTELARELTALGFEVTRGTGRGGRYFEIAGVPQELIDAWSSRHHQVQDAIRQSLQQTGGERLGVAAECRAALATRRAASSRRPAPSSTVSGRQQAGAQELYLILWGIFTFYAHVLNATFEQSVMPLGER